MKDEEAEDTEILTRLAQPREAPVAAGDDALGDRVTITERHALLCTCDPRASCTCGSPLYTGAWFVRQGGGAPRAQRVRALGAIARVLRVRGPGDITLGHVLPVQSGQLGAETAAWTLEVAVLVRPAAAELWWRGYPFAVVRRAAQVPWLTRLRLRHPLRLVHGGHALAIVDAFEHLRPAPLQLLVTEAP
jgi:hypothetical protein